MIHVSQMGEFCFQSIFDGMTSTASSDIVSLETTFCPCFTATFLLLKSNFFCTKLLNLLKKKKATALPASVWSPDWKWIFQDLISSMTNSFWDRFFFDSFVIVKCQFLSNGFRTEQLLNFLNSNKFVYIFFSFCSSSSLTVSSFIKDSLISKIVFNLLSFSSEWKIGILNFSTYTK